VCACCLIGTWCDPDEDVEGQPDAKGNLVIPSPILLSSAEEEEEEEEADKAMGGQAPAGGKQAGVGPGGQPRGKDRGGGQQLLVDKWRQTSRGTTSRPPTVAGK
jgi:hypothetical protein